MNYKTKILLSVMTVLAGTLFNSCMDTTVNTDKPEILSFSLVDPANKTGLYSSVVFTVNTNETNSTIINLTDTLPYSVYTDTIKANFSILGSFVEYSKTDDNGDTKYLPFTNNATYLNFGNPIFFRVTSSSGIQREYLVTVRCHTENPDEIVWTNKTGVILPSQTEYLKGFTLNNKLFLVDASLNGSTITNNIYTSTDGKTFSKEASNLPAGKYHTITEYNGKLYLTGYMALNSTTGYYEAHPEVWISTDGLQWTKDNSAPAFTTIFKQVIAFHNKLFVMGGTGVFANATTDAEALYSNQLIETTSDNIYTFDGSTWTNTNIKTPAGMGQRFGSMFTLNNKIFNLSGETNDNSNLSIYASENGTYWKEINQSVIPYFNRFSALINSSAISYDNSILIFGGESDNITENTMLISSNEGYNFYTPELLSNNAYNFPDGIYKPRAGSIVLVDKSKRIWVIGGYSINESTHAKEYINEVWCGKLNKF